MTNFNEIDLKEEPDELSYEKKALLFRAILAELKQSYSDLQNKKLIAEENGICFKNVYYIDPMLKTELDIAVKTKVKMGLFEIVDTYIMWMTRSMTMIHMNEISYYKNKVVKKQVDSVVPFIINYANKIDMSVAQFLKSKVNLAVD